MAIAAVFLGLAVTGILWWQSRNMELTGKPVATMPQQAPGIPGNSEQPEAAAPATPSEKTTLLPPQKGLSGAPAKPSGFKKPSSAAKPPRQQQQKAAQKKKDPILSKAEQQALYVQNWELDTVLPDIAGFREAFEYYIHQEFNDFIAAVDNIGLEIETRGYREDREQALFYLHYFKGLSYMASGKAAEAVTELEKAKTPDPFLEAKANWYLALACLQNGRIRQTEALLQQLAGNEQAGAYRQKAMYLAASLEKKK
jgi:hypothetical protein